MVAYAHDLEESGLFSRVVVQSLKTIATPFATPTSTDVEPTGTPLTPTATITPTVTPTPTPKVSDEYEVDDFEPKIIFLGQSQLHNFYPVYDVDKVEFLAKAGRYYQVFTSDLAPGVDTFLSVSVGVTTYTNDDRGPGDLNSEVVFQVGAGHDADAIVEVTNRGQYGPDKWYQITVEEIVPTPTPTPTGTQSSSLRPPGVTSLIPGLALADPSRSLHCRSKPPSRGRLMGAFPCRPAPGRNSTRPTSTTATGFWGREITTRRQCSSTLL